MLYRVSFSSGSAVSWVVLEFQEASHDKCQWHWQTCYRPADSYKSRSYHTSKRLQVALKRQIHAYYVQIHKFESTACVVQLLNWVANVLLDATRYFLIATVPQAVFHGRIH